MFVADNTVAGSAKKNNSFSSFLLIYEILSTNKVDESKAPTFGSGKPKIVNLLPTKLPSKSLSSI